MATRLLQDLYPHFTEIAITPGELNQLLENELSGPSTKFMEGGLGILSLDAGRYVVSCTGRFPIQVAQEIVAHGGLSGQTLVATFVGPPYGYGPDLVRACCAGLLRGRKIRIRPESGIEITSYRDPGVRDLFSHERVFRRAELFPAAEGEITARDRIAIRKLFEVYLHADVEPENEPITDATFLHFPAYRERLREIERRVGDLPGRPPLAPALEKLGKALEDCCRSRLIEKTVIEVKRNLDALRDGLEQLGLFQAELTTQSIDAVTAAARTRDHELAQLRQMEELAGLEEDGIALTDHLALEKPWRDAARLAPAIGRIRERYVEVRRALLNRQNAVVETASSHLKTRPGFAQLDANQAHQVLRPITDTMVDTTAEAVSPTLAEVRDRFASRIQKSEEMANDLLDQELSKTTETEVVKVDSHLRGLEITSRQQLKAVFTELEERIGPHLDRGTRVRIV